MGSARYRLFDKGVPKASGTLQPGDFNFNNATGGAQTRGIEVAFRFSLIGQHFTPQPSDEYALKVVNWEILGGGKIEVRDVSNVCEGTYCPNEVRLIVEGYKITDSYYVAGGKQYPVPVPEPGVLVSAAAVATALGAIAFVARRK